MANYLKNLLQDIGYNMVAIPKSDIQPLLLLAKEGAKEVSSLGDQLFLLFEADLVPLQMPTTQAAPISGQKVMSFDLQSGLNFLSGIFKALKLNDSKLKANAKADKSYMVEFAFQNVQEDKIGLLDLDNFLSGAIPKVGEFRTYEQKLKDSQLFVITSTLKSNEFSIKITNATGQSLDLDTVIDTAAEVNVDLKRKKDNSFTIAYNESALLVFAFKAVQIHYDRKKWFEFWEKKDAGFRIKEKRDIILKSEGQISNQATNLSIEDHTISL